MNIQKIVSLQRVRPLSAWQGEGGFPRPAEHSGISKVRIAAFAFLFFMTSLLVGLPNAYGHYIEPTGTIEVKIGDTFEIAFHPSDEFDECIVFASVSVDDPTIVSGGGEKTEHFPIFPMQALAPGTAYITTYFYGIGPECPDSDEKILTVEVAPSVTPTTTANYINCGNDGDPVSTFTGELFDGLPPDLFLGGPMPLYLSRYYASGLKQSGVTGSLGDNWRHNFEWSMSVVGTDATVISHRGKIITFSDDGSAWNLTGNMTIPYQLVESGGDYVLYDPDARLLYTFDSAGNLVSIEDGRGNTLTLAYSGSDLSTVTDGLGRTMTFTYSAGKLSSVTDGTRTVSFGYTADNLTSYTDALGNVTAYTYDTGGLMTAETLPSGNSPYTQTYNGDGKLDTQTDADGNISTFTYTPPDTTITDPLGNTRVHTHTATGEFTNNEDQAGQSIAIGYDAIGRRTSITDRLGDTTSFTYHDPSGNMSSVTNADGTSTSLTYAPRASGGVTMYDLTGVTHADATMESYTYDASGNPTSHTDQLGNVSTFTYNTNGQLLTAFNKAGGIISNTYNPDATRASTTDPAGNTTTFAYDGLKRPTQITHADASIQSMTYDDEDHPLSMTDENGNTLTLSYNANGNLVNTTDALGNSTTHTYDGNDRLLTVTDPLGGTSSTTYDALGRTGSVTDANGNVTTMGYDVTNRLTSVTDPLGNTWARAYDAEGVITSQTDPLGNMVNYVSDTMGRITRITSPLGNVGSMTYDLMGRVAATTDPLGNTTTFSRDPRGLLSGVTLPGGISAAYTRNALGQITHLADPNGNIWQRAYDTGGRQISITDPLGQTALLAYDKRNRPSTITYPGPLGTQTLAYDPAGNLTGVSYSDGTVFGFTYDVNDRMLAANSGGPDNITLAYDASGRISNTNGMDIVRDAGGRITSMTLAPGKAISYAYDANDRVIQVTDWAGGITSFAYNAAGRLVSITRSNGVVTTNTWNADGRLTGITEGSISSISLTRDAKGQITDATRTVPTPASAAALTSSANTFDAASQIVGNTYDGLGRRTASGSDTFTWNLASHLTGYTVCGTTVTATYDAFGRRTSRSEGAATSNYVWNDALGIASISVEMRSGADFRYFIHTPCGMLLYSMDASTNSHSFYHYDEMGNAIFVTDDAGAVIGSYAYSPYGQLMASTGALDNPFTWQGQFGVVQEGNSGLYYMRARYYDSATGRFISRDPVASIEPRSINPYQYASSNPMANIDPLGLFGLFGHGQIAPRPLIPGPDLVGGTPFDWPVNDQYICFEDDVTTFFDVFVEIDLPSFSSLALLSSDPICWDSAPTQTAAEADFLATLAMLDAREAALEAAAADWQAARFAWADAYDAFIAARACRNARAALQAARQAAMAAEAAFDEVVERNRRQHLDWLRSSGLDWLCSCGSVPQTNREAVKTMERCQQANTDTDNVAPEVAPPRRP